MTNSQRLALKGSEQRSALNALIEKRNKLPDGEELSAEDMTAMDNATKGVQRLEVEYRAAVVQEDAEAKEQATDEPDGEQKEINSLLARASIVPFIVEAMEHKAVDGVEAELRSATLGDELGVSHFPLDLLAQPSVLEERADTATSVAAAATGDGTVASVLERVFTRTVASRLGVSMPSVPAGSAVYPIMTGGTTASPAADGTEVDAAAGTFTGHSLEPIRLSAGYLYNQRDLHRMRSFEGVLRRDLAAVLGDKLDDQVVNGSGSAPQVSGFIHELPGVTDPSAATDWAAFIANFTGEVDGINAYDLNDIRAIMGKSVFAYAATLFRTGTTDNGPRESALDYVRARIGGMSVSSRMPAPSSNVQTGIISLTSYPGRNAVLPLWRSGQLIVDPYSQASAGRVRLTINSFFNFKILRETGYSLWKVKTA